MSEKGNEIASAPIEGFVHLHTHSEYSMLLGAARIGKLVQKAKEHGQQALALTDHGNMFGMLEFYTTCRKQEIKPIIGCDFYIAPDSRLNQAYSPVQAIYHKVILLARNHAGYKNLLRLCSIGYLEGFNMKPRIDHEVLAAHSEGLICLLGNQQGEIGHLLLHNRREDALRRLEWYGSVFGKENSFLCVQDHGIVAERQLNEEFLKLHQEASWQLVAVNDIHYVEREDAEAHDILLCIEGGWKLNEEKRPRFSSNQYYLRSELEMRELLGHYPQALENSTRIARLCDVEIKFGENYYPVCPYPDEFEDDNAYLAHLSWKGLAERYPEVTPELKERTQFELDIMRQMGVAGYMLIVQDFIVAAKGMGIPVGPGRGSAVGSLVSYAIGVTDVDPIRFNLLFERFLNPERVSMPDIDTDFSDLDRDRVIQYVVEKYGKESVAQIVTYGRMKAKMVLRDVGRVMGFEPSRLNYICKLFPANNPFADLRAALKESPDLKKEMESEPGLKRLLEIALKLEGFVRQAGMHAAAVIIAPQAVVNFAPLFKQPDSGNIMIQYDKTYSEDIGLLKMDFLGLRNLSVIKDCLAQVEREFGAKLDPLKLPEGDAKTLELLGKGQTVGVFQFESGGMQDYLRKLKPSGLEDLIAMNALYRPGPIGEIPNFIARKHGQQQIDYYHNDLKPILEETYGVIVYQEQVMQIAQTLSGFTLGGADLLRRAMAKKKVKELDKLEPKFINGAVDRGYDKAMAKRIWDVLGPFSAYAFNKSHSAAYATIAYQTAYLKAQYPAQFMAANMTSEMDDTTRLVILINDCKHLGVKIEFPNVNESTARFEARGNRILYGLGGIKNVGISAVEKLVEERTKNGPFTSIFDLCRRVDTHDLNRRALESLIFAGAIDMLPGNRAQQFAAVETALELAQRLQQDRSLGQVSLFDMGSSGPSLDEGEPRLPDIEPWPYTEMLQKEKEVLGLYLSGHPLEPYRAELESFVTMPLAPERLKEVKPDAQVIFGGMISKLKTRISQKDNKTFAFAELEDFLGSVEVVFWSDTFEEVRNLVELDSMVLVRGRFQIDTERDRLKLIAQKVLPLDEARERLTRSVHVRLRTAGLQEGSVAQIHETCTANEGACRLVLHLENLNQPEVTMVSEKVRVLPDRYFTDSLENMVGPGNVWLSNQAY